MVFVVLCRRVVVRLASFVLCFGVCAGVCATKLRWRRTMCIAYNLFCSNKANEVAVKCLEVPIMRAVKQEV